MLTKFNFADAGHFMTNKMICISGLSNETGLCSAGYYCNGGSSTPTPVGQAYGKYLFYCLFKLDNIVQTIQHFVFVPSPAIWTMFSLFVFVSISDLVSTFDPYYSITCEPDLLKLHQILSTLTCFVRCT